MQSLFSPDSKFMQAMGRIADLILLNVCFLLTCVPVFTIGASLTALYSVCFRLGTGRDQGIIKSYFRSFRENWKQATLLWLLLLACGSAACLDMWLFSRMSGPLAWAALLFAVLLLLVFLTGSWAFPLLSQFDNDLRSSLKNALFLSVGFLPRSVLITAVNLFPFLLLIFQPYLFFSTGFIWVAVYFSAAGYLNSLLLKKVFAPFLSNEEESQ